MYKVTCFYNVMFDRLVNNLGYGFSLIIQIYLDIWKVSSNFAPNKVIIGSLRVFSSAESLHPSVQLPQE